jgi:hypothetical protein
MTAGGRDNMVDDEQASTLPDRRTLDARLYELIARRLSNPFGGSIARRILRQLTPTNDNKPQFMREH